MLRRKAPVIGIAYALFMAGAIAANLWFWTRYAHAGVPREFSDLNPLEGGIAIAVLSCVAGLIVSRRPANRIGWVLVLVTFSAWFLFEFANAYTAFGVYIAPGSIPAPLLPLVISNAFSGVFFIAIGVALPLLFPDGHLLSRRWAWVLVIGLGAMLVAAPQALDPTYFAPQRLANPYGVSFLRGYGDSPIGGVSALIAAASSLAGAASVFVRYRRSGSDVRHQIKWFAAAIALLALVVAYQTVAGPASQRAPLLPIAVALVGVALAFAILKYRLYDIDVVISRTLVYGALAVFITAVYVAIVVGVGTLVGAGGKPNLALSIIATAIVAVAFQPMRERLQRLANRLVYGKRATPYEVLSQFSEHVAETYAGEEVLPRMARVLAEGTGALRADVWLRSGTLLRLGASHPLEAPGEEPLPLLDNALPTIPGAERAVAVHHQGELLGALAVSKRAGESLTPIEEKLLLDLANQAGLVLRNVGLTAELLAKLEELRASRQRLVAAQDQERRRLERNLHDGAQQNLVALKVKLGLAEMLSTSDPERARATLAELKGDADEALETLRDLARGIYPPLLADKGLKAALEAQARKATLPVSVEAEGIGRYPQEVEAAVYFCVLEALQNVQKYAAASNASVRLGEEQGQLRFEVNDDGKGFDNARTKRGAGLANMQDRLDALGGTMAIRSAPGAGANLTATIPIPSPVPAG